ncbi:MAG: DUF5615 family PIN-like protein [Pirellulales bacterium]
MSQIRLYLDEDATQHRVVASLRGRGVDVVTTLEAGMGGSEDAEQLALAASLGRSIYSLNVAHFCRLHGEFLSQNWKHSGIILIPKQRYSVGEKARRLTQLIDSLSAEEMQNRLEFL